MFRYIYCVFILVLFLPSFANAKPQVTIKYKYYEIYGTTENELRRQMNKSGIKWSDGKTYDALTRWYVKWKYQYNSESTFCEIAKVNTYVDVVFTFPRWMDKHKASSSLKRKWEEYLHNLQIHENGHKDFGVKAAAEIEQAITEMSTSDNCRKLGKHANSLGHQILDKYVRLEKKYDRTTGHGRTQGAIFP